LFRGSPCADGFIDSGHFDQRTAEEQVRMTGRRPSGRRVPDRRSAGSAALTSSFAPVRAAAGSLPDVEQTTMYGSPALKLRGRFLACMGTNKAAEPNTLVVSIGFDEREELIATEPAIYYLKDHYQSYPVVLVRLSRIPPDALESLIREAWHFVSTQPGRTRGRRAVAGGASVTRLPRPRTRARRS
jgi:hypothetical protein